MFLVSGIVTVVIPGQYVKVIWSGGVSELLVFVMAFDKSRRSYRKYLYNANGKFAKNLRINVTD